MPPMFIYPPYVQRVLIGNQFCYIIKMFSYFRGSQGVVRLRGYPYAPYVHIPPVCFDAPICVDSPLCLDAPICLDAPNVWGHPNI